MVGRQEASAMISILTDKQMATIRGFINPQTEGLTLCQQCFLSELPGVVYGIVTVIWIVGAFGLLNR
jgi:hypothetical protein